MKFGKKGRREWAIKEEGNECMIHILLQHYWNVVCDCIVCCKFCCMINSCCMTCIASLASDWIAWCKLFCMISLDNNVSLVCACIACCKFCCMINRSWSLEGYVAWACPSSCCIYSWQVCHRFCWGACGLIDFECTMILVLSGYGFGLNFPKENLLGVVPLHYGQGADASEAGLFLLVSGLQPHHQTSTLQTQPCTTSIIRTSCISTHNLITKQAPCRLSHAQHPSELHASQLTTLDSAMHNIHQNLMHLHSQPHHQISTTYQRGASHRLIMKHASTLQTPYTPSTEQSSSPCKNTLCKGWSQQASSKLQRQHAIKLLLTQVEASSYFIRSLQTR